MELELDGLTKCYLDKKAVDGSAIACGKEYTDCWGQMAREKPP